MFNALHISTFIKLTLADVYAFVSNLKNIPLWAAGLALSEVTKQGNTWVAEAPFGKVTTQQPGMLQQQFEEDVQAVAADLRTLKILLESES
jgi:hypothetical protein